MDWLLALVIAVALVIIAWIGLVTALWLNRPTRELAGPALRLLPDLVRLVRSLLADPATPRSVKAALAFLLLWLLSPIDLLPEFLPGVGALDDVIVAAVVLRWAGRRLGPGAIAAAWSGTPQGLSIVLRLLGLPRGGA